MNTKQPNPAEPHGKTTIAADRSLRPRCGPRSEDRFLYPALIDQHPLRRPPSWWHRLLRAVADSISEATIPREERRIRTEGIRAYQTEQAHRSRAVLTRRVKQGWWLGPPPYGYRLTAHDVDDGARGHSRRRRLIADTDRAPVVPVIFTWFVRDELGRTAITARLAAHPDRFPPPRDHITGRPRSWTPGVVLTILSNPAYLGYVTRGRTRHGQPQPVHRWIWSDEPSHPTLVDPALWWTARDKLHPPLRPPNADNDIDSSQGTAAHTADDRGDGRHTA